MARDRMQIERRTASSKECILPLLGSRSRMCRYTGKVYIVLGRCEEICDIAGDASRFFSF